jgi:hypothetical protein
MNIAKQTKPSATTLTTLYTVPATKSTVVSSLTICNVSATPDYFRIAVRPLGATIADEHYIYYNVLIAGYDTFIATVGLTLSTTDIVSVYSTNGTLSFSLFGKEV